MDTQSLNILVNISARLDELAKAREGIQRTKEEAMGFGELLKQGIGIGGGMELARRGVEFFKEEIVEAVHSSSALSEEIERMHNRLDLSADGFQTLGHEAKKAGTDFQEMLSSLSQYRNALGQALLDPSKASVFSQAGLDAQQLAAVPMERQLEMVAGALGAFTDANVRARLQQELFGRGAAAMTPILEKLRTDGFDKLKTSAEAAGVVMAENVSKGLDQAGNNAEEAKRRLAIALAPINQQLIETKTKLVNLLADNAGTISTGVEGAAIGSLVYGLKRGLSRAFGEGLKEAANDMAADGALKSAFENLGRSMSFPFAAALAAGVVAFVIQEVSRRAIEANNRSSAFDEGAMGGVRDINRALPKVQSDDEVRALYNRAVTLQQQATVERQKLTQTPMRSDEQNENIESLTREIDGLNRLIPLIKEKGAAYAEANAAAKVDFAQIVRNQTDIAVLETNHANFQASTYHTDAEKREEEWTFYRNKKVLLEQILDLTKKLPLPEGGPEQRDRELKRLQGEIAGAAVGANNMIPGVPLSDAAITSGQYSRFSNGLNAQGGKRLTASEGVVAGFQNYQMQTGTVGEQISSTLTGSIGGAVSTVSDGLTGLITKTKTWGDVGRSAGMLFLQTLVRLGTQLVTTQAIEATGVTHHIAGEGAKTAATSAGATTRSGIRIGETIVHGVQVAIRTAAHIASEIAQTAISVVQSGIRIAAIIAETVVFLAKAAIGALSAMASIPYVGPFLAIAAMAAILAAGAKVMHRENGGDVQKGQPYIVGEKRPEVFVPHESGTIVPSVEAYRVSMRNKAGSAGADGRSTGSNPTPPMVAGNPRVYLAMASSQEQFDELKRLPGYEVHHVGIVHRNRGSLIG